MIGPIDVDEIKLLTASFAREIGTATVQSAQWTCEVASGADPNAASRLMGVPILGSNKCQHLAGGMLAGVRYSVRCTVTDTAGLQHTAACAVEAVRFTS